MKNKVIKQIIENGNNPKEAKAMVEKYYNEVKRIYGDNLTIKKLAELIRAFTSC